MRRISSYLLLAAALLPAALALAIGNTAEAEAMRCAIVCGHPAGAAKGVECCPMGGPSEGGPAWKLCPGSEGQGIAAPRRAQPAILASRSPLAVLPSTLRGHGSTGEPLSRPATPPDHVPLALS